MSSDVSSNSSVLAASAVPAIASPAPAAAPATPVVGSAWSPLRIPIFRALWIGYVLSQIGISAREAGAQWLMTALVGNPHERSSWLGLIQTAFYLPVCGLSIAAGVWADITDRRKLLIFTNVGILAASALLGFVTLAGWTNPAWLLVFLFIIGIGTALSGPAFQYVIPELVPPKDMPLAVSLNSVALNVGRAAGPALGMAIVFAIKLLTADEARSTGGAFLVNAALFIPVVWVLVRWQRAPQKFLPHPETWLGATQTAFRYIAYSPAMRAILIRVAAFIVCAAIVWGQIAMIARVQLRGGEALFGFLMAAVGSGAVIGVFYMPKMERRFSTDGMVAICTAVFGIALIALSQCKGPLATLWLACPLAMVIGFNWVVVPTNFNIATQRSVPTWVKGRAIAMYMTVLFGSFALSGPLWGRVADLLESPDPQFKGTGVSYASLISGSLILLGLLLVKRFPLTRAIGQDFAPAARPAPSTPSIASTGALQSIIEYHVPAAQADDFIHLLRDHLRLSRLRNGATQWRLERRVDHHHPTAPPTAGHPHSSAQSAASHPAPIRFRESFNFSSWSDRLRHHSRTTKADAQLEDQAAAFCTSALDSPADPPQPTYIRPTRPLLSERLLDLITNPLRIPPPRQQWIPARSTRASFTGRLASERNNFLARVQTPWQKSIRQKLNLNN